MVFVHNIYLYIAVCRLKVLYIYLINYYARKPREMKKYSIGFFDLRRSSNAEWGQVVRTCTPSSESTLTYTQVWNLPYTVSDYNLSWLCLTFSYRLSVRSVSCNLRRAGTRPATHVAKYNLYIQCGLSRLRVQRLTCVGHMSVLLKQTKCLNIIYWSIFAGSESAHPTLPNLLFNKVFRPKRTCASFVHTVWQISVCKKRIYRCMVLVLIKKNANFLPTPSSKTYSC